jgi:hypothetical protein
LLLQYRKRSRRFRLTCEGTDHDSGVVIARDNDGRKPPLEQPIRQRRRSLQSTIRPNLHDVGPLRRPLGNWHRRCWFRRGRARGRRRRPRRGRLRRARKRQVGADVSPVALLLQPGEGRGRFGLTCERTDHDSGVVGSRHDDGWEPLPRQLAGERSSGPRSRERSRLHDVASCPALRGSRRDGLRQENSSHQGQENV